MTIVGHRITEGTTMANEAEDKRVEAIPRSPTGLAILPQVLIKVATVVVGLATVAGGIFAIFLPAPWAVTGAAICGSIIGLGATLGISSQGIRAAPVVPAVSPAEPPKP